MAHDRIYHFINQPDVDRYLSAAGLTVPSLATEGFTHASTLDQVLEVVNRLAPYDEEMMVLEIDVARVAAEIRYEESDGNGVFYPHIYGSVPREAIVATHHLDWDGEDGYTFPPVLQARLNGQ